MFVRWLLRAIGWSVIALLLIVVGYVTLMSGMWHKPTSFATTGPYVSPGGAVLVVGASSGTGREVVRELQAHGETVVAMVRSESSQEAMRAMNVATVMADAMDVAQVNAAFPLGAYKGVISVLGTSSSDLPKRINFFESLIFGPPKMDPNKRPDFVGNRHIMDAAKAAGVNRFILLSSIGAGDSYSAVPLPGRRGHSGVLPEKEKAENYLRASGLAYTIIRPGGLGYVQATGKAKLTLDNQAFSYMSRADVASLLVDALGDGTTIGQTYTAYDPERVHLWKLFMD